MTLRAWPILLAFATMFLATPASAAPSPTYQARAQQLLRILAAPGNETDFFAPLFLDAVPVDQWRATAADLRAQHGKPVALGAVRTESATAGQVEIRYERATVGFTLVVAPQPPARVHGLGGSGGHALWRSPIEDNQTVS